MAEVEPLACSPCISIDLEVCRKDGRIGAIGAIRNDTGESLLHKGSGLAKALSKLDTLAEGAEFVLGHNLIEFDLPHLAAANPGLRLLGLPVVDTLRLSPLAFPRNPYHRLVKHYQDGSLLQHRVNDPELDARLALAVFKDQLKAFRETSPILRTAWHWLCVPDFKDRDRALDRIFGEIRGLPRPFESEFVETVMRFLEGRSCLVHAEEALAKPEACGWSLAYALAWLSVAGGNSVMPPWVRHQFPEAGRIIRRLRNLACADPGCGWCRERHDAHKELKRWFGHETFRAEPADEVGNPLQQSIVEAGMAGKHVLGILPTGTGKSLCYQIPALSRYHKTGSLTVVISPLVALMADQVAGMEKKGIGCCVTINGLLSMPERSDALDRVRLGDAGILLISPEQLRSRSVRRVLDQREIGGWVLDEAHCLSRWGQDFRPDYLYTGRYIREKADKEVIPPVMCLTATARPDVKGEIQKYFEDHLGVRLDVFDGGSKRGNLAFEVIPVSGNEKFNLILELLERDSLSVPGDGAIIYCATRRQSEDIAEYLKECGIAVEHYHAGLSPETKKNVQQQFIGGDLRAIAATNAFGMGIDKPDVRLVIHADIPGSLENYLQEAGRAGRDRTSARCILLYDRKDVDDQFSMSARTRLNRADIGGILQALRNLDRKKRYEGKVIATSGEILADNEDIGFHRDDATDDTRVRTAVAWLEQAQLLQRDENFVQVFPSSLRVGSVEDAGKRLSRDDIRPVYRNQLLQIAESLINSPSDKGVSTDELMAVTGLSSEGVRKALYDMERLGIANNDTVLTAFVHVGVDRSSLKRFQEAQELETELIAHMREVAPEMGKGDSSPLNLRITAQTLRDKGILDPLPMRLRRIVQGISRDGRDAEDGRGSLSVRDLDREVVQVTLKRDWQILEETAQLRRDGAKHILDHLIECLPRSSRGLDRLAETTIGKLQRVIESDMVIINAISRSDRLLDRALLWLHEMDIIRLNKGLTIFRPAMTIRLEDADRRRGFSNADFEQLALHYQGKVLQIHVMAEYAELGLREMSEALRLTMDYFMCGEHEFLAKWMPGRDREIGRETTPESWQRIVGNLKNPEQQRIVADRRNETNVLVLAGPGSGKTRVIVHRIAYLIRARRERASSIIALAYNRHAAVEIRRRLVELIGNDARGVTVLTCHALAMRLTGFSFAALPDQPDGEMFRDVIRQAIRILRGEGLEPEEADDQREQLMAGFRWILVDEYQDINKDQYDLVSALAGRRLGEDQNKLTIIAVGDDDQNIYAYDGSSVEFIRRFETDYKAKSHFLTANYRSTGHIVSAANAVIEPARERMKAEREIRLDRTREKDPSGGDWESIDSVSRGRVQIIPTPAEPAAQALVVMKEMERLSSLDPGWNWSRCAVIARKWKFLAPVRAYCEMYGIPSQMGNEDIPGFWQLRETRALLDQVRALDPRLVSGGDLLDWLKSATDNPWQDLLRQAAEEYSDECGNGDMPVGHFIEWLAEWGRDIRRKPHGLLLLSGHRAKGLEFDHVAVLDGGWGRVGRGEDHDAPRRLYYVAMTRARKTLTLSRMQDPHPLLDLLTGNPSVVHRDMMVPELVPRELHLRHRRLSLKDVDIGFAGRKSPRDRIHSAIASLVPGDGLQTHVNDSGKWSLLDHEKKLVGRLSRKFDPPSGMRCIGGTVRAIVGRSRESTDPQYLEHVKCDHWEIVVPELVFEPDNTP